MSVVFSFAAAALIEGRVDAAWARWVRPWALAAWSMLTLGITLGAFWAYYELGWGGWWFWDPVENASFMPWLVATALLHSAIVTEKRGALAGWSVFLALAGFTFSMLGAFLVRSGVLTSVHAFAVDPTRGVLLLNTSLTVEDGQASLLDPLLRGFSVRTRTPVAAVNSASNGRSAVIFALSSASTRISGGLVQALPRAIRSVHAMLAKRFQLIILCLLRVPSSRLHIIELASKFVIELADDDGEVGFGILQHADAAVEPPAVKDGDEQHHRDEAVDDQ